MRYVFDNRNKVTSVTIVDSILLYSIAIGLESGGYQNFVFTREEHTRNQFLLTGIIEIALRRIELYGDMQKLEKSFE